jgi:hypothetical protein
LSFDRVRLGLLGILPSSQAVMYVSSKGVFTGSRGIWKGYELTVTSENGVVGSTMAKQSGAWHLYAPSASLRRGIT